MLEHEYAPRPPAGSPAPRTTPRPLPLPVHQVELVDESDQVVAALVNRPHQRHQGYVVALKTGEFRVVKRLFKTTFQLDKPKS